MDVCKWKYQIQLVHNVAMAQSKRWIGIKISLSIPVSYLDKHSSFLAEHRRDIDLSTMI